MVATTTGSILMGKNPAPGGPGIEPRWTGSDPNEVAAIIEYFRCTRADRPGLGDPRAAIRRVEERAAG